MGKKKTNKKQAKKNPERTAEKLLPQDNWMVWLFFAILISVPLVVSRWSYDQFDIIKMAVFKVLILAVVFVWLARILSKPRPFVWTWRETLLAAFLVLCALSAFTSIHIPTSLHGKYKRYGGLFTYIAYVTTYIMAMQGFRKKDQIRTLLEIISIVGGVVALYGILQFIGLDPIYWGDVPFEERRSFSTFGNPDLLAGYLVLAFPCALVMFLDNNRRKWLHGVSALILAIGLIMALTRSGWIGAFVAFMAVVIMLGRKIKDHWREVSMMAAAAAVALVFIIAYTAATPSLSVAKKFKGAFELSSGTALRRFEIWKSGLYMMRDRPLFGQGLDTFRLASEHFETKVYVESVRGGTVSDNAHNLFIHLAAGGGPITAVVLFTFFIVWIFRMIKVRPRAPDDASYLYFIAASSAALGYLATMMLGISIVGATSTFWVLMGAFSGYAAQIDPETKPYDFGGWSEGAKLAAAVPIIAITVVVAGLAVSMYVGDIYFVKGLRARDPNISDRYMNTASRLYPTNGRIQSNHGQAYLSWMSYAIRNKDKEAFNIYSQKAVEAFEKAIKAEPLEVDYKVFLANTYGNIGQRDKAIEVLDEVLEYRPHSVPGHYLMAYFQNKENNYQEAIKHYEIVFDLAPDYMEAVEALAELHKKVGNEGQAVKYRKYIESMAKE